MRHGFYYLSACFGWKRKTSRTVEVVVQTLSPDFLPTSPTITLPSYQWWVMNYEGSWILRKQISWFWFSVSPCLLIPPESKKVLIWMPQPLELEQRDSCWIFLHLQDLDDRQWFYHQHRLVNPVPPYCIPSHQPAPTNSSTAKLHCQHHENSPILIATLREKIQPPSLAPPRATRARRGWK